MEEIWKPLPGAEKYKISDQGRVIGPRGRLLKMSPDNYGYPRVHISFIKTKKMFSVHKLVLLSFVGEKPAGMQTRHLNGIKTDNRLVNLCWGTAAENSADKKIHGRGIKGEKHKLAKLNEDKVIRIRKLIRYGVTQKELSLIFGVSKSLIDKLSRRIIWKHVTL